MTTGWRSIAVRPPMTMKTMQRAAAVLVAAGQPSARAARVAVAAQRVGAWECRARSAAVALLAVAMPPRRLPAASTPTRRSARSSADRLQRGVTVPPIVLLAAEAAGAGVAPVAVRLEAASALSAVALVLSRFPSWAWRWRHWKPARHRRRPRCSGLPCSTRRAVRARPRP